MSPQISTESPGSQSSGEDENLIVVPIDRSFSDGDPATWPVASKLQLADDTNYRQKLAARWLMETGAHEEGMAYVLDSLPEGYAMFDRPRATNPEVRDKFLYGHPCGHHFDSTVKFYPHFYYLMTGGAGTCSCINCEKLKKRSGDRTKRETLREKLSGNDKLAKSSNVKPTSVKPSGKSPLGPAGKHPGKHPGKPGRQLGRSLGRPGRYPVTDQEGTPDVYKMAIRRLKLAISLDEKIEEHESMDWRAENTLLGEHLEQITIQQAYIPRLGEIVLWTPSLDGELRWNPKAGCTGVYSPSEARFVGKPQWRAGIVTQSPREDITLYDIVHTSKKQWDVNYSGFRVETFPDPLSADKSYSLHYNYVHLTCIKPFNAFEVFMQGIPREAFHPSIEYAMTVMSSFSLVNKYRIKGTWPDASIYCQAMFLGAELVLVGDAVRLKPKGCTVENALQSRITDVMVIEEIRLDLRSCIDDLNSDQLADSYQIRIRGNVYTNDSSRVAAQGNRKGPSQPMSQDDTISAFQYIGMSGYGDWYSLYADQVAEVSQDMIIGRCYEPDAMMIMFGSLSLSPDLHGVLVGREYSRQTDERISEDKHWFWGDYRAQTLAVDSINGEGVGQYSEARDVKMWRANLRILNGTATPTDMREARLPSELGRPSAKLQPTFSGMSKASKLVSTGLGATDANLAERTNGQQGSVSAALVSASASATETEDESLFKYIQERNDLKAGDDYHPGDDDLEEREEKRLKSS